MTAAVDRLLDRIGGILCAESTPLEMIVISPLARGADRIVARSVLSREGSQLEFAAPFDTDEYRRDFEAPEDLAEFEALKARAADVAPRRLLGPPPANAEARSEAVGGEHRGLRPVVRRQCDFLVSIPMQGRVNSLNLSVAAGILLYQIVLERFRAKTPSTPRKKN